MENQCKETSTPTYVYRLLGCQLIVSHHTVIGTTIYNLDKD